MCNNLESEEENWKTVEYNAFKLIFKIVDMFRENLL